MSKVFSLLKYFRTNEFISKVYGFNSNICFKDVKPISAYSKNSQSVVHKLFINYNSGKILIGMRYWKNLADIIFQYANHPESKFLNGDKHGKLERRNLEVSGVVNAIQEFQPTFLDPKLSPRTLQWAIGNQVNDFGSVHLELSDIDRMIEVSKNPVQKVLHGETSNILAGQRLIFTIASGLNATVQIEDTAYIVSVTPQFIPKDTRNNPADAVRLSIQIEDSTPRTNPDGSVDKIDRFNTSTSLILLEGQLLPLVKLDNNSKVETMEGVPNLKDVPLLGNLFRSRQSESSSIEYIVFVRATEYDIFEDANRIQDIDPFLWSTVHTVHILDSSLDTVYDLQFTKNQKNAILGRLTKDGIVVNAPFIVRIGWRRSANFISRIWKDTQRQTEQKNNSQARFSVGLLTEDDPEWVAHFSFYTLSSDNTLSKEPFLEMEEISLAEILDQL